MIQNVLVLDGCKQLSNYTLQYILQNCWKLEVLSLKGCYLITDGPFIMIHSTMREGLQDAHFAVSFIHDRSAPAQK